MPAMTSPEVLPPLSRRERRKLELRARIIETARELFVQHGFEETRVADICDRADIAHKTFFNHFPAKLDLLREIAHSGVEKLMLEIEEIRKHQPTTRDRVVAFFDSVATQTTEAGPKAREFLIELVHLISGDAAERSDQVRRLHDAFTAIVGDGLERGDITRRHDAQTLTDAILGAYYVLIFNYANIDDFPLRERARASAELVADALAPHPDEVGEQET
jgi:AcrR family transcriptional regulator